MSVYNLWDKGQKEAKLKSTLSSEWTFQSPIATPRSSSPPSKVGESIFNKYIDIIHSKSNISTDAKQTEQLDRPFDFFDDEEFAFGINLINNNVACVGDNITKLIQMAQEPWPDNVKLFQPYEVEQILLPDNASCLAVQAFLKMCNLPFDVEMRWNAEFMSPSGRVPFIKCGAFVVSELEPIVQFAANKGVSLCGRLSTEEKAEMRAYMSLITNVLVNAELYVSWLDNETFNAVTKVRNSSVYPWPLGWIQTRSKRSAVAKRLKALHWHEKTLDQVLADVEQCCNSLSQRLGEKDYFFGSPTPLDALVSGHTRALLSGRGPRAPLLVRPITGALLQHALRLARLAQMKLTPQEEYLVSQAAMSVRRRKSPSCPGSDRSGRTRRSKMGLSASRDNVHSFKPFASKQILVMPTTEGKMIFQHEGCRDSQITVVDEELYVFMKDIFDEVLVKVHEICEQREREDEKDFEIVMHANSNLDDKIAKSIDMKECDYLDTIEETELTDTTLSLDTDDVIKIIDDDSEKDDLIVVVSESNVPKTIDDDLNDSRFKFNAKNAQQRGNECGEPFAIFAREKCRIH